MRMWSCEHCGRETRDAATSCEYCLSSMCASCHDACDENRICPSTAPAGSPAAAVRERQQAEAKDLWDDLDAGEQKALLWHDTHARLPSSLASSRRKIWQRRLLKYDDSAKLKTDLGERVAAHGRRVGLTAAVAEEEVTGDARAVTRARED